MSSHFPKDKLLKGVITCNVHFVVIKVGVAFYAQSLVTPLFKILCTGLWKQPLNRCTIKLNSSYFSFGKGAFK